MSEHPLLYTTKYPWERLPKKHQDSIKGNSRAPSIQVPTHKQGTDSLQQTREKALQGIVMPLENKKHGRSYRLLMLGWRLERSQQIECPC